MKTVLALLCLFFAAPIVAFLVAKCATFGYYSGKELWERPNKNVNDKNEKGV